MHSEPSTVRLTPEELAFGHGYGTDDHVEAEVRAALQRARPGEPARILVDAIRRHNDSRRFVSFSGGVDSSLVLSAATRAARLDDVAPPVPITLRYAAASTDERVFQERMIEWLGVDDWRIIEVDDELDLIGDIARPYLRAHGVPIAPRIATTSFLLSQLDGDDQTVLFNGEGGDEVLGSAPRATRHVVRHALKRPALRRQAAQVVRTAITRRLGPATRDTSPPAWLTGNGRARYQDLLDPGSHPPRTMTEFLVRYRSAAASKRGAAEVAAQAERHHLSEVAPILDIDVIAGLLVSIPDHHFINRPLVTQRYFGDLLPPELLGRGSKVYFSEAIYNTATRAFAESWDGRTGVPLDLVDPEVVRAAWLSANDARSGLMLQSAWLASEAQS